jgi:hypothetical protein
VRQWSWRVDRASAFGLGKTASDPFPKIRMPAMPLAAQPSRARKLARGPQILAALLAGKNLDEIAREQQLPRKRVEKALRDELQRRWAPAAEDYARLQIARLERMSARLAARPRMAIPGRSTACCASRTGWIATTDSRSSCLRRPTITRARTSGCWL